MYSVLAPVAASHWRRSLATNSGPLSERRCSGTPFMTITSASAAITRALDQLRSHRIIRHSLLSVRNRYFNLPKQAHDLLRTMLLSSCHSRLLSYQFVSSTLVQKQPGIPPVRVEHHSSLVYLLYRDR